MQVEVQPKSVKPSNLRRSTRLTIAVPVEVSGTDVLGQAFSESTRTITVNRHGGKFLLSSEVRLKDPVKLTSPRLKRTVNAVVVWLGKRRSESEPREVAVELLEPGNIWGVGFPPADWDEASRTPLAENSPAAEAAAATPAPADLAGETKPANPAGVSAPASNPLDETVRWPAAPLPLAAAPEEKSAGASRANGNGRGSDAVPAEFAESIDSIIKTSLAGFEQELNRIIKIHSKAFEKRAFATAMESVEVARKEMQKAGPSLVQESVTELRRQVQHDMESFATYLEELKQRATSDAMSTLRGRLAAALKALEG